MSLKVSDYFLLLNVVSSLLMLLYDVELGARYAFAASCLVVPYYLFPIPLRLKQTALFISFVLWLTHLLRPFVLVPNLELFKYANFSSIDNVLIQKTLVQTGLYSGCLLAGFCVTAMFLAPSRQTLMANGHLAAPADGVLAAAGYVGQPIRRVRTLLESKRQYIKSATTVALFVSMLFAVFLKIGVKKTAASSSGIWGFFVPEIFIHLACLLYIFKYKQHVRFYASMLVAFILLGLVGGSKGALAEIAILAVIYFLYERGDFKISLKRALITSVSAVLLLFATFAIANQIRFTILFAGQSYGFNVVQAFAAGLAEALRLDNVVYFVDLITTRFNGFDGLLVTNIQQTELLKEAFSLSNTVSRIVGKLIPFDGGVATMTTGKAVGIAYIGFDSDKAFSGAVGIWGALTLMAGAYTPVFAFGLGAIWSAIICCFQRVKDLDVSFILQGFVMLTITESVMSGNFDNTGSWLIIRCVQLMFYIFLINFLSSNKVAA